MEAKRHREGNVVAITCRDHDVLGANELWRLLVIEPGSGQQRSLHGTKQQTAGHDLLAGRTLEGFDHPCSALHGSVEERIQCAHLRGYIALAVEVHCEVLCQRSSFLLDLAVTEAFLLELLFGDLVGRQTDGVFQRIVVVAEPIKDGASTSLSLALSDLRHLVQQGLCTVLCAAKVISEACLPAFLLELLPEVCHLAFNFFTFAALSHAGVDGPQ